MTLSDINSGCEIREDVPLKNVTKDSKCFFFDKETIGGSKFINISFAVLTAVITFFLLIQIYYGDYQIIPQGSVASDSKECSEIGTNILKLGGNAIDATISSAICLAVVCPHINGLDSSGQAVIYDHRRRENAVIVDFSHVDNMRPNLRRLVIALIFLHKHYGTLDWKVLIKPAVDLAKKGFLVSKMLEQAVQNEEPQYFDTNVVAGQIIKIDQLAETLDNIQEMPIDDVYNSIPDENLPKVYAASNFTFMNFNIYVPNNMDNMLANILSKVETWNAINRYENQLNAKYFGNLINVAKQLTWKTVNEFKTSSNIAVMDTNDFYISFISGMNSFFGSKNISEGGYFVDDKNKSGFSARVPFIIIDQFICGRRIVSGSNDVITAAQIISSLLYGMENITASIESPRFNIINGHLALEEHEPLFSTETIQELERVDNHIQVLNPPYFSCNIVEKKKDDLGSHSDSRGGGISSRF